MKFQLREEDGAMGKHWKDQYTGLNPVMFANIRDLSLAIFRAHLFALILFFGKMGKNQYVFPVCKSTSFLILFFGKMGKNQYVFPVCKSSSFYENGL